MTLSIKEDLGDARGELSWDTIGLGGLGMISVPATFLHIPNLDDIIEIGGGVNQVAGIQFNRNGQLGIELTAGVVVTNNQTDWIRITERSSTVGDDYEVRTVAAPPIDGWFNSPATDGNFVAITASRTWNQIDVNVDPGVFRETGRVQFQVREIANPDNIVTMTVSNFFVNRTS